MKVKSKKVKYNTLIRDGLIYSLIEFQSSFKTHIVKNNAEFLQAMGEKVLADADRVKKSVENFTYPQGPDDKTDRREKIIESMADLMEIYICLLEKLKISPKMVNDKMRKSREKDGSYKKGVILEWLEELVEDKHNED